jgi:cytochrome c biogenesis protein CcdA
MLDAIDVPFAYAFTLGMVATVNPCGFPMLPAYLSFFIGTDADEGAAPGGGWAGSRIPRALLAAAAVSLGFMAVFTVLSVPLDAGVTTVYRVMPWLTIAVGVLLIAVGVGMLLGYKPTLALPRLERGGRDRRFGSMVLFGVSYAIASLSCTIPLFLSVVANRTGPAASALTVVAYGLGMSAVLTGLTLALALARDSVVARVRRLLPHLQRVSGALLVAVGLYLVYYWVFNLARDPSDTIGNNPFRGLESARTAVATFLEGQGTRLGVVVALAAGVALAVAGRRRRPHGVDRPSAERHDAAGAGAGDDELVAR